MFSSKTKIIKAFPLMSTGVYGYSFGETCEFLLREVRTYLERNNVENVRFLF